MRSAFEKGFASVFSFPDLPGDGDRGLLEGDSVARSALAASSLLRQDLLRRSDSGSERISSDTQTLDGRGDLRRVHRCPSGLQRYDMLPQRLNPISHHSESGANLGLQFVHYDVPRDQQHGYSE